MNHFINLKDVLAKDLRKIVSDAKKRKNFRKKLSTLEVDKGAPLKGKLEAEKSAIQSELRQIKRFENKPIAWVRLSSKSSPG